MSNSPVFSNRLIHEKSPYLLQHAHNPVDWYPWGPEAFECARALDRPVLLSVGYSTCHWCHVMVQESFENKDIAQMINDNFVAVKVDREERLDVDYIYMTATQTMTGQGGWPLTVFLTPQGDAFYGGTYFPPYAKWGSMGFMDLLISIKDAWNTDRENILSSSRVLTESLRWHARENTVGTDTALPDEAFRQMKGQFDALNGGFGHSPKFPMGHSLSFLLRYYKDKNESEALHMAEKTLTAISRGGIWDHLGKGFHRYSTDRNWHVPHFEKMLYDQALLSRSYLEAYQLVGRADYAVSAQEIFDYVLRDMTGPAGGFYSAQDADSSFYVFSKVEIVGVLGAPAAEVFNYCYGVLPEGENILYLEHDIEDAADKFHKNTDEIEDWLVRGRAKLLAWRRQRSSLHLDDKVLTNWNGLMISSLSFGSRVLQQEKYRKAACQAADFILKHLLVDGRLLHRWRDNSAGIPATLEDYAFFIYGLLDLYEATFEDKYLDLSQTLADGMIDLFADEKGGFYLTACDADDMIVRFTQVYDGALPSGNSVAVFILLRLYALTKKDLYQSLALASMSCFTGSIGQNPLSYTFMLSALEWSRQGAWEIVLEGNAHDARVAKMLKVLYKYFMPYKSVKFIPTSALSGARICHRGTCHPLVADPDMFEHLLLGG